MSAEDFDGVEFDHETAREAIRDINDFLSWIKRATIQPEPVSIGNGQEMSSDIDFGQISVQQMIGGHFGLNSFVTAPAVTSGNDDIAAYLGDDDAAREDDGATYFDSGAGSLSEPQFNGSGATTTSVAASGDQSIDGLLSGVRWNGSISYSDPDAVGDYQATHPESFTNFSQVTAQQIVSVHFGLNAAAYTQSPTAAGFSVEGFTNLSITYAGSGSGTGTIRVANTDDPGTAYAYYPNSGDSGGDAFFGPSGDFPDAGDYDWHTVLHELGHSLGLAHGHTSGAYGASPASEDSLEWSIMTYRTYIGGPTSGYTYEAWGAPQTFMRNDILALQHMYGADYTTNSGNTVYSWAPGSGDTVVNGTTAIDAGGNVIFATIWDGGGTDTYDLSAYTGGVNIDLTPGAGSIFDDTQRTYLGGSSQYASHSVYNAFLYDGNTASLIENAIGGSGNDTMQGNQGVNTLTGNGGDDTIHGGMGSDSLYGNLGDDVLYGGADDDVLSGGWGQDSLRGGYGNDSLQGNGGSDHLHGARGSDLLGGASGNDTIIGNNGFDQIYGGSGLDQIDGGLGNDTIYGGLHNDTILGNTGSDVIGGGHGSDDISGQGGNDVIHGNDGYDKIDGGWGHDQLNGDAGADTLTGNRGSDTITGGTGSDVFVFGSSIGSDVVTDFQDDIDQLDFSGNAQINNSNQFVNAAVQQGSDVIVDVGNGTIVLENTTLAQFDSGDLIFS